MKGFFFFFLCLVSFSYLFFFTFIFSFSVIFIIFIFCSAIYGISPFVGLPGYFMYRLKKFTKSTE